MLSTVYAQKVLSNDPSIKFVASVLNGPVNIWDETCTAINGWCSNEAVYKAWDAMGRPDTGDFMPPNYDLVIDPDMRRGIIAEARISAIAQVIQDQLYGLIIDMLFSGKLKVVPATLVEGPEDPHGATWVEGGIPGIIECDCYVMEGDNMWEELIEEIAKQDMFLSYLDKLQLSVTGYVDLDKGWNLTLINHWFAERGYEFVGYLDLFSENEASGIFVAVEGLVWRCNTNIADNQLYWYFETKASEAISLDDMCFMHGWAHQFIWDSDDKECYIVNIAE